MAVVLLGLAVKVCRDVATLSIAVDCEVKKVPGGRALRQIGRDSPGI